MNFNQLFTIIICFLTLCISCYTKKEVFIEKEIIKEDIQLKQDTTIYKDEIEISNIKTVLCYQKEKENSLAIINLHSNDKLVISFDDLDADRKDYYYTIIHCNSDWTESDLMQSEYINGFYEEPITNYEFSYNTIQKYTHYQFEFPSAQMQPVISGNYIFKIYLKNKNVIFYKRFMVLEKKLQIDANVRKATLAENRKVKHEIDFKIKHPNIVIPDPFKDIKVHIKQNNREDNAITNLTPLFVKNDELIYDYDDENTFWGNNEFRYFDFKSIRYHSEKVKDIKFDSIYNHVYLFSDNKRAFDHYTIQPDINGKFIIKCQEAWQSNIEADYAYIHFTLNSEYFSYADVYLLGEFSEWKIQKDFKLKYNTKNKQYQANVYLKQGYYNYTYALVDKGSNYIDVTTTEGTHYQTRNDYYIYVYLRNKSDRYDKLVGFMKTASKELF